MKRENANQLPENFGFRSGPKGTHTSRTIMLAELIALLGDRPERAGKGDYREAIVAENVLGKRTASARRITAKRLAELYALDPNVTVFRLLLFFWKADPAGRPLLAFLCAAARDPLLRQTARPVLAARPGERVVTAALAETVAETFPGRFKPSTCGQIARNTASSWTQAGHLSGHRNKVRSRPVTTPGTAAYALALGYLAGTRGPMLLHTFWAKLLDRTPKEVGELAAEASRRGWIDYRQTGSVVEVRFPKLLTEAEQESLRGEAG